MSAFEVPSPPPHHIEVLGSVGGGVTAVISDYDSKSLGGGLDGVVLQLVATVGSGGGAGAGSSAYGGDVFFGALFEL
ncbi:MAG: hypothetical protein ACXVEF_15285 [Polyangiales bacterium]